MAWAWAWARTSENGSTNVYAVIDTTNCVLYCSYYAVLRYLPVVPDSRCPRYPVRSTILPVHHYCTTVIIIVYSTHHSYICFGILGPVWMGCQRWQTSLSHAKNTPKISHASASRLHVTEFWRMTDWSVIMSSLAAHQYRALVYSQMATFHPDTLFVVIFFLLALIILQLFIIEFLLSRTPFSNQTVYNIKTVHVLRVAVFPFLNLCH